MAWLTNYLTSSIGRKLTMSLTGLFMILFLVVHLLGNFQLLKDDGGEAFNKYTYFMTHFPLIKMISYGLYAFIILHTVQGLMLALANRKAKGQQYACQDTPSWGDVGIGQYGFARHFDSGFSYHPHGAVWGQMHFGDVSTKVYADFAEGEPIKDLYALVADAFKNPLVIAIYVVGQIVLAFHLCMVFQSAFQTLGVNHPKYTPFIKGFGKFLRLLYRLVSQ